MRNSQFMAGRSNAFRNDAEIIRQSKHGLCAAGESEAHEEILTSTKLDEPHCRPVSSSVQPSVMAGNFGKKFSIWKRLVWNLEHGARKAVKVIIIGIEPFVDLAIVIRMDK